MRAFVAAMLTVVAVAAGAYYGLHWAGSTTAEAQSGAAVRLGD